MVPKKFKALPEAEALKRIEEAIHYGILSEDCDVGFTPEFWEVIIRVMDDHCGDTADPTDLPSLQDWLDTLSMTREELLSMSNSFGSTAVKVFLGGKVDDETLDRLAWVATAQLYSTFHTQMRQLDPRDLVRRIGN